MRDWPVIFSGPMVRALWDDRKSMTRRLPTPMWHAMAQHHEAGEECWLWVREAWSDAAVDGNREILIFRADDHPEAWQIDRWRPSIHMPRWASRLSLKVEAIGLERLWDVSEEDVIAEGWREEVEGIDNPFLPSLWFRDLWNGLHSKSGTTWADNPAVVAIRFSVHRRNINDILAGKEAA